MMVLGRAFGIPIRVDRSWFISFALVASSLALVYFPRVLPAAPPVVHWAWGVGSALLLFVSLVAYEVAHALTAQRYGIRVESITLHLLGGVSQMVEEPSTPRAELLIAAAGPGMSFALAGMAFGARAIVGGPVSLLVLFGYVGAANLVIAVFNLLPGYPLDGGRLVRASLWASRGSFDWATRVASTIGRVTGLMLAGFGAANAAASGELISGLWLVMVGIFVHQSARAAGRLGETRERRAPVEVEPIEGHVA